MIGLNKKIILILVVLISLTFVSCNSNKNLDYNDVENAGKLLEVYEDGKLVGYQRPSFNNKELLSKLDVYDINNELQYFKTFEYNDDGLLIQETWYKSNGIGDYYYTYEYNDAGEVIEKGYYPAQGNVTITLYNNGKETDIYKYNEKDELEIHSKYEDGEWINYDADGKLIE